MTAQIALPLLDEGGPRTVTLAPGAVVLRGFALDDETSLCADLTEVLARAPLRHLVTPGGRRMSVATTSCGALGWVSAPTGYHYAALDPDRGAPWPRMPASFSRLATAAAHAAGFEGFVPDACLINRYAPGARLSLHQDKNERDLNAPIVSVSLGLPAVFLFGGLERSEKPDRIRLCHGDVAVWGGPARLHYHGVLPVAAGHHPRFGSNRVNLTFRRAR